MIKKVSIQLVLLMALAVPVLLTGCHGHEGSAPHKAAHDAKKVPASAVAPVRVLNEGGVEYIVVPQTALFRQGALVGVLAVNVDGRVEARWVSTGHTVGSDVIVLAGLERDSQIVGSYDPELEGGVFVKQNQAAAEEVQSNE
ncbi:conserved hypothetical protein [Chlorobaculum parvum NCIB 8327]|uniref:Multidrug resistance protein MdtA-like C-terminal permuted SH3 domain-containing protein n=2 Tax=Chlorobaculum parvum TaxID=274539 RepID=B3QL77_CHLP8|nr:conserved hypothetical protein [Chlorobaculum parvum NCIB 8327]